jgi:arylsulfatase A-like enzyme
MASRTWVCGGLLTLGSPWCRRPSATVLAYLLLSLLVSRPSLAGVASARNVLFIPIDDLNDWVGFLGTHPQVSTPNMDRLAARGVIFSDAHCAAPVCNPSRAAVFSGKQPFNTGVFHNNDNLLVLQPNLVYLPEHFADNGYRTLGAGKQLHLSSSVIFQDFFNTHQRWSPFTDALVEYTAAEQPSKGTDNPVHVVNFDGQQFILPLNRMPSLRTPNTTEGESVDWGAIDLPDDEWGEVRIADWAVSELAAGSSEPFFLACGFFRPHIPLWIPQRYLDMYPSASVVMPVVPSDDLDDIGEIAQLLTLEKDTIDLFQGILDYNQWEPAVAAYLACITFVDDQVGKLLDALDASPHANNTIIVLWSDHGFHLGEKNHFGKFTPWERSTRVPLVIVPAVADAGTYATGVTCDQPVSLLDLYPTLIELCGLPPKPELDGGSLVPLLQNPNGCADRPVLTTLRDNYTVRTQRWRFVRYEDGVEELYDRLVDPGEFDNLVGEQKYDYIRDRLRPCLPTFDGIDVCEIPDDSPGAVDDTFAVAIGSSDEPLDVLANDFCPNPAGTVTVVSVTQPTAGSTSVSLDNSQVLFTPAAAQSVQTFSYTMADETGAESSATATVLVAPAGIGELYVQPSDVAGTVSMEAENAQENLARSGYSWQQVAIGGDSSGFSMQTQPKDFQRWNSGYGANSPQLTFRIFFQQTGTYFVWLRALGVGGSANSLHVGFNGQEIPEGVNVTIPTGMGFVWEDDASPGPVTVSIPAVGVYNINVWPRETGTVLDKVLVTKDATLVPTGLGTAETPKVNLGGSGGNVAPQATDDMPDVIADSTSNALDVLTNDSDPDGDGFSIQSVDDGGTAVGTVTISGDSQSLLYTPPPTFTGTDTFTYTIVDDDADPLTGMATVMVNVMPPPPNQSPTQLDDNPNVLVDSSANPLNVLSNDSDPDGDGFSIQSVDDGMTAVGTVTISGDALSLIYTPPATFTGTDTFTYTIVDDDANPLTGVATVNVMVDALSGDAYQQDSAGLLVMEAENRSSDSAAATGDTWQETSTPATSRGVAMRVPGLFKRWKTNVESTAPEMVFEFVAQVPGLHHVWFRSQCANGGANSVHYGLGGSVLRKIDLVVSSDWVWNGGGATHVVNIPAPGTYFFSVWTRESASGIDTVLLTPDATALTPTELDPAESSRAP